MRWPAFLQRGRRDREIAEEIAAHIEMATRERIERGEPADEARFAAMREFGNVDLVRDATRHVWLSTRMEQALQDLRFGSRILWQAPGFSATAVLLVALVIGGNTTVYSVVRGLLTRPAPGVTADRLVGIGQASIQSAFIEPYTSYPNYLDYASRATTIDRFAAWTGERLTLRVETGSYAVNGALVTAPFFEILAVRIARGRAFRTSDDDLTEAGLAVVISDRLWQERFQRAEDAIGRAVLVNGLPATIIGVAASPFRGVMLNPGQDVWLPITAFHHAVGSRNLLRDRRQGAVVIMGRLAPRASLKEAQAEFAALSAQLRAAYPAENTDHRAAVFEYSGTAFLPLAVMGPRFLAIFSIVTVLTLLVVSANVANLMLARAVVRQRETAIRQSLGASRARIMRMLLAEGAAVSLTAWAAASLFAWWVSRGLVHLLPPLRDALLPDIGPDWRVAAYAMALATVATMAFTIAPAVRAWRQEVLPWLKAGEQAVVPGRSRLSSALVVVQLAFSVVLLTGAGLAYRSLSLLESGDVGFSHDNIVLITIQVGRSEYLPRDEAMTPAERDAAFARFERIRERLREVPGVQAVSYARRTPGPYAWGPVQIWRKGHAKPAYAVRREVGPDYLEVLDLSPVAGRALTERDRRGATRTAMINQHLAKALFPGESPLGHTILVGSEREPLYVIGVTPNALFDGPVHDPRPGFVFVAEQQLTGMPAQAPAFFVRYRGTLESMVPALTKGLAQLDASLPVVSVQTMSSALESVTVFQRTIAILLLVFAAGSLIVAALGQYAIAAFNMRRRTRDFGIRMALGATSRQIQRSVLREALRLTAAGLAIGFALSAAAGAAIRSVLFGITPTDPITYTGVFTLLGFASLLASYLPAWRAGQVDVIGVLRDE